ncbi:glycosyltransferase [Clostridium tyrobutyricum]|uniref:glycosyltransferase n=1 Tax=Clostridium tyrobutyricum TaxID=1519 RepID=UPI00068ADC0B|nr:glycosyltransferase [Clostridium tyrobutyricum]
MKYKILVISPFVPYDKVGHAGGKVHNYYLKRFNNDKDYNVKLITFAELSEKIKIDLKKYSIDYKVFYNYNKFYHKLKRLLFYNISKKFNPFDKNAGFVDYYNKRTIINYLNELKLKKYQPDIIILAWTQVVLLIPYIKKVYPSCKYIAIEHDVSYLSLYRKHLYAKNSIKKYIRFIKYKNLKKSELRNLKEFDLIMPLNIKDMNLLLEENLETYAKLDYICPYFTNLSFVKPNFEENNIIFFGAMDRQENYDSCIWFIENVFNKLLKIDKSFKFFIVGNKPNEKLYKYANDNIVITGFVEDITLYFNKALCMVVPLLLGAGIKIKVLEGMSAGLPVLTNDIGIEGIPASNNDFIYCKVVDDYISNIMLLKDDTNKAREIGNNAKKFIKDNFNLDESYEKYKENILKLMDK